MDGENQKDGSNTATVSGHSDLAHDQPVLLRSSEDTAVAPLNTHQEVAKTSPPPAVPSPTSELTDGLDIPPADTGADKPTSPYASDGALDTHEVEKIFSTNRPELSWTASEFIEHPKSTNWYLALGGTTIVVALLAYLFTRDVITVVVIMICASLFGYTASRKPRQLEYALGNKGISIGPKFYPYSDFSSFSVIPEGAFSSIDFMPLKRFAPILSIYYDPATEPHLMDVLSLHLPVAPHKRTMIDDLMHRIRF